MLSKISREYIFLIHSDYIHLMFYMQEIVYHIIRIYISRNHRLHSYIYIHIPTTLCLLVGHIYSKLEWSRQTGGGICGISTALALQRKGVKCVVLERSESMRAVGNGIIIQPNGWYALEQLGVAAKLRRTAVLIKGGQKLCMGTGRRDEITFGEVEGEKFPEVRCLMRKVLIKGMAEELLPNTIRYGNHVVSMKLDPYSSSRLLVLSDGTQLKAKVVIGADGVNSVIADYVGVRATQLFSVCAVRGYTYYKDCHHFANELLVLSLPLRNVIVGRIPMTDNLVYWFMTRDWSSQDISIVNQPELIRESSMQDVESFPQEIQDMVKNSEPGSMHKAQLKYRPPWEIMRRNFQKGTVALAGDSMHAMGPFIAQGGSASLEDAVVLARCLGKEVDEENIISPTLVEKALRQYVKERKTRIVRLSTETYLVGRLIETKSGLMKLILIVLLAVFFRGNVTHTKFRCGEL